MMKQKLIGIFVGLILLGMSGMAGVSQAALVKIGQGIHWDGINGVTTSNLIWDTDTDLNGDSLIWLDYSAPQKSWGDQKFWAQGINTMVITLDSGYTVAWGTTSWRMPDAHNQDGSGPDYGHNVTDSEMGHLFYDELGFSSNRDWNSTSVTDSELNASEFNNLIASWYWSGTEYASYQDGAWYFSMLYGLQSYDSKFNTGYGFAVRSGQVSTVPVPGTIVLLASGLLGLVTVRTRRNGNRC